MLSMILLAKTVEPEHLAPVTQISSNICDVLS